MPVKQYCFDAVIPFLAAECEREGLDVSRAFPEPAGMEQWRKDHPTPVKQEDQGQGTPAESSG